MPIRDSIITKWQSQVFDFDQELKRVFNVKCFENNFFSIDKAERLSLGSNRLQQAIEYSLFGGGKRFRPLLTFASCQVLRQDFKNAIHWAMAVECVHTYSLIHDDLPCMDNDDLRRGLPTVHKKFDEATALLAGDALLTEAFGLLGKGYFQNKNMGHLIQLLCDRAGFKGMVSGQANDLFYFEKQKLKSSVNRQSSDLLFEDTSEIKNQILFVHLQKTAALISAACVGPFLIFDKDKNIINNFTDLGLILGILFQLKDDFLDAKEKSENNIIQSLGFSEAETVYSKYMIEAERLINSMPTDLDLSSYRDLISYNDTRSS